VKPSGLVVRELYDGPVPAGRTTLDAFLRKGGTPGISGVDTRRLTLSLRDRGSRNGVIVCPEDGRSLSAAERERVLEYLGAFPQMEGRELVREVGSVDAPAVVSGAGSGKRIALLDCGIKANIVRRLSALGCELVIVPSTATAAQIDEASPDALFISNGPGDPAVLENQVRLIRDSIGKRPVLGICLGHQLIAQAIGAKTYKMKFGHHGVNHPVRDEQTGAVFVTSQNHGFAVDEKTLPESCEVWFRNANDGSVEGLADRTQHILSTQFHPESAPGPHDAHWVFERFLAEVE
jgi:carbamoyl-phosphate synthase small subunit